MSQILNEEFGDTAQSVFTVLCVKPTQGPRFDPQLPTCSRYTSLWWSRSVGIRLSPFPLTSQFSFCPIQLKEIERGGVKTATRRDEFLVLALSPINNPGGRKKRGGRGKRGAGGRGGCEEHVNLKTHLQRKIGLESNVAKSVSSCNQRQLRLARTQMFSKLLP